MKFWSISLKTAYGIFIFLKLNHIIFLVNADFYEKENRCLEMQRATL